MAIRSPRSNAKWKAAPKANPQLFRIRPSSSQLARLSCGEADCHTSDTGHWFAMTCKRLAGVYGCKGVFRREWGHVVHGCGDAKAGRVSACHCEERSDVAIRSPRSNAKWEAAPKANPQLFRIRPSSSQLARLSCGEADCHTSDTGHWFAMTCKRLAGVYGCKGVFRREWGHVVHGCGDAKAGRVSAYHCEERSDVAIRSPRSNAKWEAAPKANPQLFRICPSSGQLARLSCGEADCHTSVRTGSQ